MVERPAATGPAAAGIGPVARRPCPVRSVAIGHRPSRFPRLMAATARARGAVGTDLMAVGTDLMAVGTGLMAVGTGLMAVGTGPMAV
jgi:hypothetical protein